jgi:hypothetical protein
MMKAEIASEITKSVAKRLAREPCAGWAFGAELLRDVLDKPAMTYLFRCITEGFDSWKVSDGSTISCQCDRKTVDRPSSSFLPFATGRW